jgi:hypothetical protein
LNVTSKYLKNVFVVMNLFQDGKLWSTLGEYMGFLCVVCVVTRFRLTFRTSIVIWNLTNKLHPSVFVAKNLFLNGEL